MKLFLCGIIVVCLTILPAAQAADPVVSNVRASQRPGTKLVDIWYDLADADSPTLSVTVAVSTNNGVAFDLPAWSFSGSGYGVVSPGNNRQIVWDAGWDWAGKYSTSVRFRVTASDSSAGMALIPAGSFQMGDPFSEGGSEERPVHTVYVSAFYMDKTEVTKAYWDDIKNWGTVNRAYRSESVV